MTLFRLISLAFLAALLGSGFAAAARAEPTIAMSGDGWKAKKTFEGIKYSCEVPACGGAAVVELSRMKVLSNTEEELNKPYVNIRAFVNDMILYAYDGQYGGWKFTDAKKTKTPDYTAVHMAGAYQDVDVAIMLIVQGGRMFILSSVAESPSLARANLAKAFKSGDFRRPG
ncbi:MAG: hypothetical protein J0H11_19800 [Rhizobiales bacterium]|nr:hypothetical protein [Hyphomicrobiales bacterium]